MGIKERQERDREAVRRAILDAARELFVHEGFNNISIRKIAERIEYSPAAIYGYFPSKDDIFFALAEEGFRLLCDERRHPCLQSLPAIERVREIFWRFYTFSREQPQYFALMFVDRTVPRISREYERFAFARDMKAELLAHVHEATVAGDLPASLPADVLFQLLSSALIGVAVLRLSERLGPEDDADALARDVLDVTLAGLRAGLPLRTSSAHCALDDGRRISTPDTHVS